MDGLTLVIPAWNEEDRLARTLERYLPSLESRNLPFEIIVVCDSVGDRTAEVASSYSGRGVRLLTFPQKLGKGGAVLEGMKEAKFAYIGYFDADGPIAPAEMYKLVDALSNVDCVVASRWITGSQVLRQEPWFNLFAGRFWNSLVRAVLFLPVRDTQCGAKVLKASVVRPLLRAVTLTNRAFDVDLLYHVRKSGHSLAEVPVQWDHDPDTRMPIGRAIPVMFLSLAGVRIMNLPIGRRVPRNLVKWFSDTWGRD
ncbi:MAG: glycosyltransferase [Thermoplasmata archaeon]|nr:glycosyltransferase [Thermoplasmata archaeon]